MVAKKGRPPMDDRAWVIKHLKPLMDEGKSMQSKSASLGAKLPTYDKGYWTGLKLMLLKYYVRPYLEILVRQGKRVAYVDLFAGPGLDLIGNRKVPVLGSPMIPLIIKDTPFRFSQFLFSDTDSGTFGALQQRVNMVGELDGTCRVLNEDANAVVGKLPGLLSESDHALVFLDPEGMEFAWDSVRDLVNNVECDLVINFPSAGLNRNLQYREAEPTVRRFLGLGPLEQIPEGANEAWAIDRYRKNLASIGKDISMEIRVNSGLSYHYHLIPAVRKTGGGSPWFRPIFQPAKERIERMSGKVLGLIAEQIEGEQGTL
ncbi:MAG: three-Cys-motif partner protein TcmP [Nitrososphaerota archaeon]|jgi:three-Cys-motif partner protein|nr:three-Cys-motif partner protein TcmP [Nitrososphaerota archaeon]